jgi:hypothetical protein
MTEALAELVFAGFFEYPKSLGIGTFPKLLVLKTACRRRSIQIA